MPALTLSWRESRMIAEAMSPQVQEWIRRDYESGMTLLEVGLKYHWVTKRDLRGVLEGTIRPGGGPSREELSEEELVARRDEIKERWTPEQARLRWVGRYLSRPESLGSSLSKALRELGGDA
jgi:hypothetical protein